VDARHADKPEKASMSVQVQRRRSSLITACMAACVGATAVATTAQVAIPRGAPAGYEQPGHGVRIVRPSRTNVSGTIVFSMRGIGPDVRWIVFMVDGRTVWSTSRLAPRATRPTVVNTRKLRDGRHVLALRVIYANRRTQVVRKAIVVYNPHPAPGAPVPSATATGASTTAPAGSTTGAGGSMSAPAGSASSGSSGVTAVSPPTGGVPGPSMANFNRETYLYRTNLSTAEEANRYQFMVLSGNEYAEIPLLKAANPNLKFLLYQAIWMTNINDIATMPTVTGCTPYADDMANHPSWFLRDQNGNLITETGHPDVYAMDVGNSAYQQACATNAAALARQYGFDGVFFDVVDGRISDDVDSSVSVPEYPTQASWDNAMDSALAYLAPALRAQGLSVFGNGSNTISVSMWEQWVGHLDGVEEESWTDAGYGLAQQIPFWAGKFTELNWAAANGKYEFLHSYNTTEAANTFGLAAMLLGASGRASYSATNGATTDEYWFPEYDTAKALGAPAGSYTVLANGVYERAFANGIVLANPTGNSISTFSLGGGTYTGSGLTNVQSVALGPTSGLVLLKTG
jgi:hypothetical protein